MKIKIVLLLILFLIVPFELLAKNLIIIGPVLHSTTASCADQSCTGFLICQNFQGSSPDYDNSESWTEVSGSIDPNNTTNALRNSEDVLMHWSTSTAILQKTFTAQSEAYGHFLFRTADATPAALQTILSISDGTTAQLLIRVGTTGRLGISDKSSTVYTADNANGKIVDDTPYHIWWHYLKGTGANATLSVEFTAIGVYTPVGSGDAFAEKTGGDSDQDISYYQFYEDKNINVQFDQVLLKASTAIGTVCN